MNYRPYNYCYYQNVLTVVNSGVSLVLVEPGNHQGIWNYNFYLIYGGDLFLSSFYSVQLNYYSFLFHLDQELNSQLIRR